ncbi:MAG: cell wall-binding repeat-containing protein [Actinomycetota bacterium]|nr:cell wall-binding repeat-containing protein [Actinomycetota bacterium]
MHTWNAVGRRMAVGVAVVALVSLGWTSISSATVSTTATVGNDISFPQCGSAYPSGQAFAIVGVNDGIPNTLNPCFGPSASYPSYTQSELYWAVSTSTGSSTEPKASVYVNTADPGNVATGTLVGDWPTSGSTPYGTCTTTTVTTSSGTAVAGANSPACAWEYGNTKATQDAAYLQAAAQAINAQSPPVTVPSTPAGYPWWLDVETANTWKTGSSGQAMNVAMLQGIVTGLTAAGAPSVGIYSPPTQWAAITGGTTATTPTLGTLATWLPGASDEAGAQTVCTEPSFTAGPVALAQYPSGAFDGDQSCADPTVTRIYGQTADTTAAAELTRAFPWTAGSCPTTRTAVVATTNEYQDALSSQFLAQHLTTGTLLTPTGSLSQVTATTLEKEGITTVDVVGGPLALSTTVVKAIENLPADQCGGVNPVGNVVVHRIFGKTQYGTAMAVAELVGSAGSKAFPGAYSTTNATGGTGMFNDTAGSGSPAPSGSLPTAILASGEEFQDAQAASVLSYRTHLPMLLTPATQLSTTAVAAIEKLGIEQVILMGGPLAVSNTVEASLVAKTGVSVLRIAGKDYTDTSRELARFEVAAATDGLDWTPGHRVTVARGNGYTDGLAGAVLESPHNAATGASRAPHPLLLIESPTTVGPYIATFLTVTGHGGIGGATTKTVRTLTVLGGPLAVTTASVTQMQTDLGH